MRHKMTSSSWTLGGLLGGLPRRPSVDDSSRASARSAASLHAEAPLHRGASFARNNAREATVLEMLGIAADHPPDLPVRRATGGSAAG